jgi:hypothetical protein
LSHGYSIDHPDPELGEQLMADALGVVDRDAMHGILSQLVKASVNGEEPDAVNLAFVISMVKSIKPRDSVEAQRTFRSTTTRSQSIVWQSRAEGLGQPPGYRDRNRNRSPESATLVFR